MARLNAESMFARAVESHGSRRLVRQRARPSVGLGRKTIEPVAEAFFVVVASRELARSDVAVELQPGGVGQVVAIQVHAAEPDVVGSRRRLELELGEILRI